MQKFFSNRRLIIILIAIIVSFSLISFSVSVRNKKSTPPLIQEFGNDVVGLFDRAVSYPANGLKRSVVGISDLLNTYQENQKLKKQVDKLAQVQVESDTVKNENKQLKKELKLNSTLTDYTSINASVLTRLPSGWLNQLVISKGSASGVKKNAPVMAGSGLIGRVIEVNKTNSKVELISTTNDSANRFAVQVTNSDGDIVNGLITGYDKTDNLLIMGQITSKKPLKKGDAVVTSGLGGTTPKGLNIGDVAKIEKGDYGLASKIYIKPAADLSDLTVVTIAQTLN
ncbi:cell shape-determining protein MreC [Dellaglioa algida]|nr:cell shape-determining protein MreC [Dellaglioa algida]